MSQHSEPANQKKNKKNPGLPWEQRRHQSSRAVLEQACAHKQQNSERSRGECTPTLTPAGCWIASGCRVCTYVCVRVRFPLARSQLSACSARLAMCASVHVCVCVSLQRVRFPTHHKTQNAMTNKSLISSFLPQQHKAQPNPCANTPSAGRGRRRRRPTCGVFVFGREGRRRRRRRTARGGWI